MSVPKPEVRLTRRAEQDYEDIVLYTRRTWGERQKTTYRKAIGQALRRRRDHPQLGRPQDDLFIGCRGLQVEQHVVYYHRRGRRKSSCSAQFRATDRHYRMTEDRAGSSSTATVSTEPAIQRDRDPFDPVLALLDEWLADESGYDEAAWPELEDALIPDHARDGKRVADDDGCGVVAPHRPSG